VPSLLTGPVILHFIPLLLYYCYNIVGRNALQAPWCRWWRVHCKLRWDRAGLFTLLV